MYNVWILDKIPLNSYFAEGLQPVNKVEFERLLRYLIEDSNGKPFTYTGLSINLKLLSYHLSFRGIDSRLIELINTESIFYPCVLRADYFILTEGVKRELMVERDKQQAMEIYNMFKNNSSEIKNYFEFIDTFYIFPSETYLNEFVKVELYKRNTKMIPEEYLGYNCNYGYLGPID